MRAVLLSRLAVDPELRGRTDGSGPAGLNAALVLGRRTHAPLAGRSRPGRSAGRGRNELASYPTVAVERGADALVVDAAAGD